MLGKGAIISHDVRFATQKLAARGYWVLREAERLTDSRPRFREACKCGTLAAHNSPTTLGF
jgi:hypothetical protein